MTTENEYEIIFVKWITNKKTGKRIYPKTGKAFPIRVRRKK